MKIKRSYLDLLGFCEAAYRSYTDDPETWAKRRPTVKRQAEPNAYYDWFFRDR